MYTVYMILDISFHVKSMYEIGVSLRAGGQSLCLSRDEIEPE